MSGQRLESVSEALSDLAPTERINPHTTEIDLVDTQTMLRLINAEDQQVALAVQAAIPEIARLVDHVAAAFSSGGRLFYVGAGTSGRLGVLDASECPPTYGVATSLVQGIIAGGETALRNPVEGAEDDPVAGERAIREAGVGASDIMVGLSASGGARYVVCAVQTARSLGALTGAITCHPGGALATAAEIVITADVGPEVIAGSTRMKAGTAQKLILNMITTGAMIAWGKTYRNLMVDLKPTNTKLRERARRLVAGLSGQPSDVAQSALDAAQGRVKHATVMLCCGVDAAGAEAMLAQHHGKLRAVLEHVKPV